jgi:hypothetical protein
MSCTTWQVLSNVGAAPAQLTGMNAIIDEAATPRWWPWAATRSGSPTCRTPWTCCSHLSYEERELVEPMARIPYHY